MTTRTTGRTERVNQLKTHLATAVESYQQAQTILEEIASFTAAERCAIARDVIDAYGIFHNLVYTGAVGFLAKDRDVQQRLRVRNAWELLTDIGGIERKKIKGILDAVTLVDATITAAVEYLPDFTTTTNSNEGGVTSGDDGIGAGSADGTEAATGASGAASGGDEDGLELGVFNLQPTDEPIDVVFGDLYKNANSKADGAGAGSAAAGPGSGAKGKAATASTSGAGAATDSTATASGDSATGAKVKKPRVETPEEEAARKQKRLEKMKVEDTRQAALSPYKAEALKRYNDYLVAYKDQLDAGGKEFAATVAADLRALIDQHTDINAFERAARNLLVVTFPTPRASAEYLAKHRGMNFKRNDQRTGYLLSGFITNEDYQIIHALIKANQHHMAATRSEELRRIAKEHAEAGTHADGVLCDACRVVKEAGASGKELSFRVSSKKERDLDALIYTLAAGGGDRGEIAVEAFMIPELAYLDNNGKLRTGSAVKFINFDELLGFQAKRKIAVGCDARTGQPLVAGWIHPELNANRAIGTLTKSMVFVQHQQCCGEGCEVPFEDCELHHIIPYAKGGLTVPGNLIPLCQACHMRMRDLNESQGGAYYTKALDGTIKAFDRHGERVIPQISDNWIKDHIDHGLPVPILVTTAPLPLKEFVKQDWDYTTPGAEDDATTANSGRSRETEAAEPQHQHS